MAATLHSWSRSSQTHRELLTPEALAVGSRLGSYEILGLLGAGGMGEVYLARDTRLGREVALKVLPPDLARDAERLLRFEREARAVAALNHPNVVTLHSVEEAEGLRYLVMERVTGHPLSKLVCPGGLPIARILELAIPIADALSAAHDKGIVHRDLKPGNVMVSREGRVKVLDFGLSKLHVASPLLDGSQLSTHPVTSDGQVLGTILYMAPEQLRGDRVDARSDIYAFGAVLYELASGLRPFGGQSNVDVMSAILREEPRPLEEVRPGLPARFTRIVKRCLEKDPHRRVQSAIDLRDELQDLAEELHGAPAHAIPAAAPPSSVSSGAGAIDVPRRYTRLALAGMAIAAVAIVVAVLIPRVRSRPPVAGDAHAIASLAVLPFDNMTHDASQDYFVEGMHDAVITELAKLGVIRVTSRNSVMRYKGQSLSLREVAHQLDVDALIEGAVLREGNRVRITAQLILGSTDEHVWAESYDRDLQDVLALLTGVSRAIAVEVQTRVGRGNAAAPALPEPAATPRIRPEAYEAYLRGREVIRQATSPAVVTQALDYFERAASLDPGFAHAWSGLAFANMLRAFFGLTPAVEAVPIARRAAQKALALDNREGDAHFTLGSIDLYFDWNFEAALPKLERAIALSPHDPWARHAYADYLMVTGRFDESLQQVRLGRNYDPTSPLAQAVVVFHTMATRRYDEVIGESRRVLESFPNMMMVHGLIGNALWKEQRYEEALPELKQAFGGDAEGSRLFEDTFRRSGHNAAMKAYADHLAGLAGIGDAVGIAGYYAEAGERDAAFHWLEKAYADRAPQLLHVPATPAFDAVRDDPRFHDLIRRIGIPWTGVVPK